VGGDGAVADAEGLAEAAVGARGGHHDLRSVRRAVVGAEMKASMGLTWANRIRRISAVLVLPTTSQITFGGAPRSSVQATVSSLSRFSRSAA
jgi:hypothetical protein